MAEAVATTATGSSFGNANAVRSEFVPADDLRHASLERWHVQRSLKSTGERQVELG